MLGPMLLALATVTMAPTEELPAPPMVFDVPEAPPAPRADAPAAVVLEPVVSDGARSLLRPSAIDGGFGSIGMVFTSLNGVMSALSTVSVDATRGSWIAGLALVSGTNGATDLTYVGPRLGAWLASTGVWDFTAGMLFGAGATSNPEGTDSASVFVLQPEIAARARVLPWMRASATVGYRMVNAGEWGGPGGDALGGLTIGFGLDFGQITAS